MEENPDNRIDGEKRTNTELETDVIPDSDLDTSEEKEGNNANSKLKSLITYGSLGIIGYASTIMWTIPFREFHRRGLEETTFATDMMMSLLAIVLGTVTFGALYFKFSDKEISYIDVNIPNKRDGAIIIFGGILLLLTIYLMSIVTTVFDTSSSDHTMTTVSQSEISPAFVLMLVPLSFIAIAPAEEFVFRNIVQKGLYADFTKVSAVGISSLIFVLVHIPTYATGNIEQVLMSLIHIFILSVILGGAYVYTENLMIPIIMHGTYNASVYLGWYLELTFGLTIW